MIGLLVMLSKLWRSPITRAIALPLVLTCAGLLHGVNRYRHGRTDGVAFERAANSATAAIAKASSDSVWSVLFAINVAQRDSITKSQAAVDRQMIRTAAAMARAEDAEAAYAAARRQDTTTSPVLRACDALAVTCREARVAAEQQRDSMTVVTMTLTRAIQITDSLLATEPTRTRSAVQQGIQTFRATLPRPKRLPFFLAGLATGLLALTIPR